MEDKANQQNSNQGQVFSRENLQSPGQPPIPQMPQVEPEFQAAAGLPVTPGVVPENKEVPEKKKGGLGIGKLGMAIAGLAIWGVIIWWVLKPQTTEQTINPPNLQQQGEKAEVGQEPGIEDFTQTDEEVELPVIALMDDLTATQPPLEEESVLNNALDQISGDGQAAMPKINGQITGKSILDWLGISGAPEQGYEIGEITVDGDQAQVVVKLKDNSGVQERTFQVSKILSGGWKIEGVSK